MDSFIDLDDYIKRVVDIIKSSEKITNKLVNKTKSGILTVDVIDGELNGEVTLVSHKNKPIFNIMVFNNLIEGPATIYNSRGDLSGIAEYKHGKPIGKLTLLYDGQQVKEEANFSYDKPGEKEGLRTTWYENNQVKSIINYHDGKRVGQYVEYNKDGDIIEEGNYAADGSGKKEGLWMQWYRKDFPMHEITYINGKEHGISKLWSEHGEISREVLYDHGNRLEFRLYFDGKRLESITEYDKDGSEITYKEWDPDNNLIEERENFPEIQKLKRQVKYDYNSDGVRDIIYLYEVNALLGSITITENGVTKVFYGTRRFKLNELINNVLKELYQAANDLLQENRVQILERSYQMGIPIPAFPHDETILLTDKSLLPFFRTFTIDKSFHKKYHDSLKEYESDLIHVWIYGEYREFNLYFNDRNMNKIPMINGNYELPTFPVHDLSWKEDYGQYGIDVYSTLRNSILNAPPLPHKVYSWRYVSGFVELCSKGMPSDLIIFNRLLASSFAFEIACSFGGETDYCSDVDQDGIPSSNFQCNEETLMFLLELPAGTNALDLTSVKRSEQELLLPDRSVFQVIRRIPNYFCPNTRREILHIRLIGLAAPYRIDSDGEIEQPQGPDRIKYEIMYDTPEKYHNIFFY